MISDRITFMQKIPIKFKGLDSDTMNVSILWQIFDTITFCCDFFF
jgi:hypothetical protein